MENVFREVNHVFRTSPFSFGKGQGVGTGPAVLMATQNAIELDSANAVMPVSTPRIQLFSAAECGIRGLQNFSD